MTSRDRLGGALAALTVQALLGWLLIAGLATSWRRSADPALAVFRVAPRPPPPPPAEPPFEHRSGRHKDAAAPPNLPSTATELVAPPPILPMLAPPPVVAALQPSTGVQATSGAALVAGPGAGAGGAGNGLGGGGDGDGSPPRLRQGRLKDQDYPQGAALAGSTGTVGVRYLVGVDGRVGECRVTRPSGSAELDAITCHLIQERFRFDPSRDARGRKVPAWVVESHEWVIDRPPPPAR